MRHLFYFTIFLFLFNCNSKSKDAQSYTAKSDANSAYKENKGKKLMETNCYACHSPTAGHDNRLAPPMEAVKNHYINEDTSKIEFVTAMQTWIKNPNKEDAKMFGAVKRFGVMPKQSFPEETIKLIAEYLYENEVDKPEWFEEHHKRNKE